MPKFLTKWETLGSNWMDIQGYSKYFDYPTENSEYLLERVIKSVTKAGDLVLDFFAGSGTTAAVAEKLGWLRLAEKSLEKVWNNKKDEKVWRKYL